MRGPRGGVPLSLEERFTAKVDASASPNECWNWGGFIDKAGYGRLRLGGRDSAVGYAHRISYQLHVAPIPEGLVIDHLCRNTRCVNPAHLEPVTTRENVLRGDAGEAQRTDRCVRGHDLIEHGYTAKNGRRSCQECKRLIRSGQADMTEAQWQKTVIDLARTFGWRVAHFRAAQTSKGWRTPVAADGAGFPDLVLLRERSVFLELKKDVGELQDDQKVWLAALLAAGTEAYVARPRDVEDLALILAGRLTTGRPTGWLPAAARLKTSTEQDIS